MCCISKLNRKQDKNTYLVGSFKFSDEVVLGKRTKKHFRNKM